MAKNLVVCDFDGTVNRIDVGSSIIRRYLPNSWNDVKTAYNTGKLTNYAMYNNVFLPLMKRRGKEIFTEVDRFLVPNSGFREFYEYCKNEGHELIILSDGFDFYINSFLQKFNFSIKFYSNTILMHKNNLDISFSYQNPDCDKCGTCKYEIMKRLVDKHKNVVYIGDGDSDICPSKLPQAFWGKRKVLQKIRKNGFNRNVPDFYFYDFLHLKNAFNRIKRYRAVIFDLDGTLVDGFDIIYESFNYALRALKLKEVPIKKIKKVIGPALSEGFRMLVPEHLIEEGVSLYRSYYKERYLNRNTLFSGMKDLLVELKKRGVLVGLITNKKEPFALELINHLNLNRCFDFIKGADNGFLPKPDSMMMDEILNRYRLEKSQVLYVGDSEIDGAFSNNAGVDFIAVGMGLGKEKELYKFKPLAYCKDTFALKNVLYYLIPRNL